MSDYEGPPAIAVRGKCPSFRPGHSVHWIPATRASRDGRWRRDRIVAVTDDGTIQLASGRPCWNHDPSGVRAAIARSGPDVTISKGYPILRVGPTGEEGAAYFCIATEADACRS